jgi:hypothetical protein
MSAGLAGVGGLPLTPWLVECSDPGEAFIGPRFRGEGEAESRRRLASAVDQFVKCIVRRRRGAER